MTEDEIVYSLSKKEISAFVCKHLCDRSRNDLGFNVPYNSDDLEAWCDECEKILTEEGGWTDRVVEFADIQGCCIGCFVAIKNRMSR